MQDDAESTRAKAPTGADEEQGRLEALLVARAAEVRALTEELARVRGILRDVVARPGAAPVAGDEDELVRLRGERDRAVARAVEAETARAAAGFALDEARGRLVAQAPTGDGARDAALSGRERGLRARLAETLEERDAFEARLALAEDDLAQAAARTRALERELGDVREQLDLAVAQVARQASASVAQASLSALRGELAGLRARSEEGETAFESARVALARTRAEAAAQHADASARLGRARETLVAMRATFSELVAALRAARTQGPETPVETTLVGIDAPPSTRPP